MHMQVLKNRATEKQQLKTKGGGLDGYGHRVPWEEGGDGISRGCDLETRRSSSFIMAGEREKPRGVGGVRVQVLLAG